MVGLSVPASLNWGNIKNGSVLLGKCILMLKLTGLPVPLPCIVTETCLCPDVYRPQSAHQPGGLHPWPVGRHLSGRCYILLGFPGSSWRVCEWWQVVISYYYFEFLCKHVDFWSICSTLTLSDMKTSFIAAHLPAWATDQHMEQVHLLFNCNMLTLFKYCY